MDKERGRCTLRRIDTGGSWRQKTIDQNIDGIMEVSASVRKTIGVSQMGYSLMYDHQVDAFGHFNLARVHRVCAQLETDVLEGARDISAIMINVISDQPVDPLLPIPMVHPFSDTSLQTTPQHVVDLVFASRRSNQLPPDVVIGPSVWVFDPRHLSADSDDSAEDSDGSPEVVHPPLPERLPTRSVKRAASPPPAQPTVSRVCVKPLLPPHASFDPAPVYTSHTFNADFVPPG